MIEYTATRTGIEKREKEHNNKVLWDTDIEKKEEKKTGLREPKKKVEPIACVGEPAAELIWKQSTLWEKFSGFVIEKERKELQWWRQISICCAVRPHKRPPTPSGCDSTFDRNKRTCDGYFGRPFARPVQNRLLDSLHVTDMTALFNSEHGPICGGVFFSLLFYYLLHTYYGMTLFSFF